MPRRGRGSGRGPPSYFSNRTKTRPLCQVSHKYGHTALSCYHRFNQAYQALSPSSLSANLTHTAPSPPTTVWYPDSGATNHFTSDLNNLILESLSHQGPDEASIGDGSTLPIQHIGSAHLHTPNGKFLLTQLLHVPSITKNLNSVRQFFLDNKVFFEFHTHFFFVKDLQTREVLLLRTVENGLNVMPTDASTSAVSSMSPHSLLGERTSSHDWHLRLGNPSSQATTHTINHFQLPVISEGNPFCIAHSQVKTHALRHPPSSS